MFRNPECVDALEARLATNVTYTKASKDNAFTHIVEAKGFRHGEGRTALEAVQDFVTRNYLAR